MRKIVSAALFAVAAGLGMPVLARPAAEQGQTEPGPTEPVRERRSIVAAPASHPGYRSKRKPARRVPKANRLPISRRTRRKYRRSKAA